MTFFDSLVHATADGSWLGGTKYDASRQRLLQELDAANVSRACLVAIADHVDNDTVAAISRENPEKFIPIGSLNPSRLRDVASVRKPVADIAKAGFAGLKLHPRLNGYDPLDDRAVAAVRSAGEEGLVVFIDTLFRQKGVATLHPADVADQLAVRCPHTRIVLLHGGGSALLQIADVVAAHQNLVLDLSFTLLRYQGSSLDLDLKYVFRMLDRRTVIGSDFPEYTPSEVLARFHELARDLAEEKQANMLHKNLTELFSTWRPR
ncbi:MAG: amidohydrolase family protein [Planctomycetaceae bacterium]